MAYSELIKSFQKIRSYLREFYVYGFKSREEFTAKSARSYDNERRRVESWLGDYMSFRQDASGKQVFLSVDSRSIPQNPLYKAFKAKSFTDKDITLHFYLMDLLAEGRELSLKEILTEMEVRYLSSFENLFSPDESTVRKKLKEYMELGLISGTKKGKELFYKRTDEPSVDLSSWKDALNFFSEEAPLGVVGSFLQDKLASSSDKFRFKHHYILHALDSDILYSLLLAIDRQCAVELTVKSLRSGLDRKHLVCPLKIYSSTQTGRQYLLSFDYKGKHLTFYRIDAIEKVSIKKEEPNFQRYLDYHEKFRQNLWGVSVGTEPTLDHIEMTLYYGADEGHIPKRLEREKRCGKVDYPDESHCRFIADVYDAVELLPWLRTFIGRITDLQCTNPAVMQTFREDLLQLTAMYGGERDALQ